MKLFVVDLSINKVFTVTQDFTVNQDLSRALRLERLEIAVWIGHFGRYKTSESLLERSRQVFKIGSTLKCRNALSLSFTLLAYLYIYLFLSIGLDINILVSSFDLKRVFIKILAFIFWFTLILHRILISSNKICH